jgi:hypothetical protein
MQKDLAIVPSLVSGQSFSFETTGWMIKNTSVDSQMHICASRFQFPPVPSSSDLKSHFLLVASVCRRSSPCRGTTSRVRYGTCTPHLKNLSTPTRVSASSERVERTLNPVGASKRSGMTRLGRRPAPDHVPAAADTEADRGPDR